MSIAKWEGNAKKQDFFFLHDWGENKSIHFPEWMKMHWLISELPWIWWSVQTSLKFLTYRSYCRCRVPQLCQSTACLITEGCLWELSSATGSGAQMVLWDISSPALCVGKAEFWEEKQAGIFIGVVNVGTGDFYPITGCCVAQLSPLGYKSLLNSLVAYVGKLN